MKRLTKKLVIALAGLGALSATLNDASACGGSGGGGRPHGGFGGFRPQPHHSQRYVQPSYPQPQFQHSPNAQQPLGGLPQQGFGQPGSQFAGQPADGNFGGLPPTVKKMANVRSTGAAANPQFAQSPQMPVQQRGGQVSGGQFAGGQPSTVNPLQSLGGSVPQDQGPFGQQQNGSQVAFNEQAQSQQGQIAQGNSQQQMARRPAAAARPAMQPQAQQSQSPMGEAQLSALQALGGFDDQPVATEEPQAFEEAQPSQATQASSNRSRGPIHVGNWTASLPNGAKVELTLQADGSFSWVATSGEKTSSFDGNYTVAGGMLTLVRSSDNQKLAGSLTPAGSGKFNFKLTGAKDAGLNFSRS